MKLPTSKTCFHSRELHSCKAISLNTALDLQFFDLGFTAKRIIQTVVEFTESNSQITDTVRDSTLYALPR